MWTSSYHIFAENYRIVFTASNMPRFWMRSRYSFTKAVSPGTVSLRFSCQMFSAASTPSATFCVSPVAQRSVSICMISGASFGWIGAPSALVPPL